jgi:hypothetical protein
MKQIELKRAFSSWPQLVQWIGISNFPISRNQTEGVYVIILMFQSHWGPQMFQNLTCENENSQRRPLQIDYFKL